jgi:sec-independent protein translocase protein TatA
MANVGPLELVVVLVIALIVFGPKRLPELGQSLGRGIREFKNSLSDESDGSEDANESAALEPGKQAGSVPPSPESQSQVTKKTT